MRLLPSLEQTVALAVRLQAAGASVITLHGELAPASPPIPNPTFNLSPPLHTPCPYPPPRSSHEAAASRRLCAGRTREQKCSVECSWESIRAVKAALAIPVVANGGIERPEDIERCLAATGCDAVMLSEAALENPAIFGGQPTSRATQLDATRQYLRLARAHPPRTSSVIKAHLFKLLYLTLQAALRPGTTLHRLNPYTHPCRLHLFVPRVAARRAQALSRTAGRGATARRDPRRGRGGVQGGGAAAAGGSGGHAPAVRHGGL